jgi:hypothetical protein
MAATTLPLRSIGNFVKFHLISPSAFFEYIGNVTLYLREQKVLISSLAPGSRAPKLLAGKPAMTKPRSLYFS